MGLRAKFRQSRLATHKRRAETHANRLEAYNASIESRASQSEPCEQSVVSEQSAMEPGPNVQETLLRMETELRELRALISAKTRDTAPSEAAVALGPGGGSVAETSSDASYWTPRCDPKQAKSNQSSEFTAANLPASSETYDSDLDISVYLSAAVSGDVSGEVSAALASDASWWSESATPRPVLRARNGISYK